MNNILIGISATIALALFSGLAYADPVVKARTEGSSFFVHATNNENVRYNCNLSYSIKHTDFGETKTDSFQQSSSIGPNESKDILRFPTAWAVPLEVVSFNAQCFKGQ